jgi:hypothetical protein
MQKRKTFGEISFYNEDWLMSLLTKFTVNIHSVPKRPASGAFAILEMVTEIFTA